LEALNRGLRRSLADDNNVLLLGEDIADPYGGAFKVTRGLSTQYPGRVLNTPISEAGFIGVALGMALRGLRPVAEIMFGDFITLAADQLINHASKFRWMYGDGLPSHAPVQTSMVLRTPMGGRRGYGPTHSQSLEKIYLAMAVLRVLAPCHFGDPGELLYQTVLNTNGPVVFIENKLQYLLPVGLPPDIAIQEGKHETMKETVPSTPEYRLAVRDAPHATLTLAAYGYMAELACQAMLRLAYESEIFTEVLIPTDLSSFSLPAIRTERLMVIEEGTLQLGWAAEIMARVLESGKTFKAASRLAAASLPTPASGPLEALALPDVEQIVQLAKKMV